MGLVIAFGGLFGFKQWQSWQDNNRQQASMEFEVMNSLLGQEQLDAAMTNFQNLQDDHAKSPYTSMARHLFFVPGGAPGHPHPPSVFARSLQCEPVRKVDAREECH